LVVFDAHYGPGATLDSAPDSSTDTAVPPRETNAVCQVLAELQLKKGDSLQQTVQMLNRYFLSKYTYTTWQRPRRFSSSDETPLTRFLLQTHRGHCEYFATAGVLLLRQLGIPARYAVGYAVHEGSGDKFVVRQRDAHAWCLVWDRRTETWQDLDLTPGSWVALEAERAAPLQWLRDAWSWVSFEFSKIRWGQSHWRKYVLWALIPTLALLLYRIVFQTRRRHRPLEPPAGAVAARPGVDSEFYELEIKLASLGLARQPSEPLSDWLHRVLREASLLNLQAPLQELLHLHYRYRFDPLGLRPEERSALRREARACLAQIEQTPSPANAPGLPA
jgi:hypothetical protein